MAVAEERFLSNPALDAAWRGREVQQATERRVNISVAERLMRRAHESTFVVPIADDIEIEMFTPTDGEYMELIRLQNDMLKTGARIQRAGVRDIDQATGAVDEISAGWDRLHDLIARLCVDPSLDFEFFRTGMISAADKEKIVHGIIKQVKGNQEAAGKFR